MASHDQLLLFWLQLVALLAVARSLGGLLRRIGLPAVVGELAAGLVLGPSVFGQLAPAWQAWLFPGDPVQMAMLAAVGWVGAFLLMIVTGYETDLRLIRRLGGATARVTVGSLLLPLALGVGVGLLMPAVFLGERAERSVFALFVGIALGISALPVIAKVLSELGLMRRTVAQVILTAAMANDLAGWILLGVVAGLARSGHFDASGLAFTGFGLALFLLVAFLPGQRAVDALLRGVRIRRSGAFGAAGVMVLAGLAAGALTHAIGLEAVFGAFIAGIVLGRSRYQEHEAFAALHAVTFSFLAPLFFASAGLRVDLTLLAQREVWVWGLVVLAVASLSKFAGAYLGARLAGLPRREGMALGAGLNARGAVEIVVATVGLSLGVLSPESYTVVVLLAMATSMMAPPLLRWALSTWKGSREERERLERERVLGANVLVRALPILLPSHGGPNSVLAARLLDLAWPAEAEAVVLSVGGDAPEADVQRVAAAFRHRVARRESIRGGDRLGAILDHAALGYGVIALGATDARVEGRLVSPLVDDLLSASPLPVVMVRRGAGAPPAGAGAPPADAGELPIRRILVPAIGTQPGRTAQEMAFGLAAALGAEVVIAHVVTAPTPAQEVALPGWMHDTLGAAPGASANEGSISVAERVVGEARALAGEFGAHARTVIRTGLFTPDVLLALARDEQVDLIVLAANLRQLSGRPFLGHGVEYLLEKSECAVAVVTAPPGFAR